jgi:hypothetical protein
VDRLISDANWNAPLRKALTPNTLAMRDPGQGTMPNRPRGFPMDAYRRGDEGLVPVHQH